MNQCSFKPSIMIVDDTPANLSLLSNVLKERGYNVRPFSRGKLAFDSAKKNPPDLILLDIYMPEMDGYELCTLLKSDAYLKDIPVIFISTQRETLDKVKAFGVGGVDYVSKPFQFDEVEARVNTHLRLRSYQLHLEQLVDEQVSEISEAQLATIMAISAIAESRDDDTGQHLKRIQHFCLTLTNTMSKTESYSKRIDYKFIYNLFHASQLHDIGKMAVPDYILKKPDQLEADEYEIMKKHTTYGSDMLRTVYKQYPRNNLIKIGIEITQSHHERWDGHGYPEGLAGDEIPLYAQIVAVADMYDTLRSKKSFKKAFSREKCKDAIVSLSGTNFSPDIVDAFKVCEEDFDSIFKNDYTSWPSSLKTKVAGNSV